MRALPDFCVGCADCSGRALKVLVCGGRRWGELPCRPNGVVMRDHPDYPAKLAEMMAVKAELDRLSEPDERHPLGKVRITVIHGGADGADRCADEWAIINWSTCDKYEADWSRYGPSAGPIRNSLMLSAGKPDLVLAFPGGRGTSDMTTKALRAGVKVVFWEPPRENRA